MRSPYATQAREAIEHLLAPQRQRHQARAPLIFDLPLWQAVRQPMQGSRKDWRWTAFGSPDAALARVHDLCSEELAIRMNIAKKELVNACRGIRVDTTEILLEELKIEVEAYLSEEMSKLADEELLLTVIFRRWPQILTGNRRLSLA